MKVRELINILQTFDPETIVVNYNSYDGGYFLLNPLNTRLIDVVNKPLEFSDYCDFQKSLDKEDEKIKVLSFGE
jgi:hypothetical protein